MDIKNLNLKSVVKGDINYDEERLTWNRRIDKKPSAIIYCTSNDDVKEALQFVKENKLEFRIRSGRHHYEGFSTGNDIIVIDVSEMKKISVDLEENKVIVEAGVRNRELYEALGTFNIPFPGGGCPTVGVIPYALGGGWGYSCRHLGLGVDSLIEAEIINFNGEILICNEKENKDLFWALKGSGSGNFGVVTKLTFTLPKREKIGTLVYIDFKNLKTGDMKKIFNIWQKNIDTLDSRLTMKTVFYNSDEKGMGIHILGIFYGEKDEALEVLNPFLKNYREEVIDLKEMSILEINRWIQNNHPDFEKYKSTGRFLIEKIKEEEIENILEILNKKKNGTVYTAISLYSCGGNILKTDENTASYAYRNAKGILGFQALYEEDGFREENNKYILENLPIIYKNTRGSFVNFPIKELENYEKEYFGESLERLKKIKKMYDSENFFNFEQGIKID